jgi:caa(3)-type oxidase subunit IV
MDDIRAGLHARLLSYAILLALLALNVTLAQLPLGRAGTTAQLVIASLMAFIVIWVFMQVGDASGLVRTFAGASLLWLALMFVFTLTDYLAR